MSKLGYVTGGYTPLMMAAEEGNLSRVKQYIPKSQINQKNDSGYTALALSVKSGKFEVVQELLKQGSDYNSRNNAGQSILFLACWYNHEDIVQELLKSGAEVDAYDQRGWTSLMIAVYHNHSKVVKILLDHGANPRHKDSFGKDCVSRCKSSEIRDLLLKKTEKSKSPLKGAKSREITPNRIKTQTIVKPPQPQEVKKFVQSPVNKFPVQDDKSEDKFFKFKDELERHIKASTTTLACHAAEDCMNKLRRNLSTEMNKAYERLYENALSDLNHHIKEMYNSMARKLLADLETNCRNNGLNIPPDYHLQGLQLPVHAKRGPPKLPPQNFGRVYDQLIKAPSKIVSSKDVTLSAEELESELYEFIDKEIESLSQKLDTISTLQIKEEVTARVQQISQFIIQEMEHNINSMVNSLYMELQAVVEDRMQEILSCNLQPMSRPPSAPALPRLNLEVLKDPMENTDYIQSIANNYRK